MIYTVVLIPSAARTRVLLTEGATSCCERTTEQVTALAASPPSGQLPAHGAVREGGAEDARVAEDSRPVLEPALHTELPDPERERQHLDRGDAQAEQLRFGGRDRSLGYRRAHTYGATKRILAAVADLAQHACSMMNGSAMERERA
jgi:hypothetical protein